PARLCEPQKHCLVYASLRLRFRSAALARPLGFHLDFADAKRAKSPFRRAGDDFLTGSSFFARLVIVPAGTVLFVNKENQKTDAASESNANIVCKLPSDEEEGEAKL
ncbi:hypothetical protein, partial [uncultured Rikenella sp.]|uniref:hypothetical protein n=2 Tax=uncultured Rikenella sp. TaxID=368003 RepID=UPI0025D8AC65